MRALMLLAIVARTAMPASGIPVRIWLDWRFPTCSGSDMSRLIANEFTGHLQPYQFEVTNDQSAANLQISVTHLDNNWKFSAEFHGYTGPNTVPITEPVPLDNSTKPVLLTGLNCETWPARIKDIIDKSDAVRELRSTLSQGMPFAKGIRLLKPPPPHVPQDGWIQILFPIAPQFTFGTQFEIEYGNNRNRMVSDAITCVASGTASYVIVQPNQVAFPTPAPNPRRTEEITRHFADFDIVYREAADELVYTAQTFSAGRPRQCGSSQDYTPPRPQQISASTQPH